MTIVVTFLIGLFVGLTLPATYRNIKDLWKSSKLAGKWNVFKNRKTISEFKKFLKENDFLSPKK